MPTAATMMLITTILVLFSMLEIIKFLFSTSRKKNPNNLCKLFDLFLKLLRANRINQNEKIESHKWQKLESGMGKMRLR